MNQTGSTLKRKITAIMAADVAEYARIIAEDEEDGLARLVSYRQVFDDFVTRAGGRVFNTGGDSVMCEFPSAVEAVRCAIDIQESLRTRNLAYPPSRQMRFRIGISIGDVVDRDGDLLGDGVNVASRLQSLAKPGSVCVARNVQEAVANKISLPFRDLGHRDVKNLPHPVHAFEIEFDLTGARTPSPSKAALSLLALIRSPAMAAALWLLVGAVVAAGGAGLYWLGRAEQPVAPTNVVVLTRPIDPPELVAPPGDAVVVTEGLTPLLAFERLARSGGLVRHATSAPELYHNARIFEARGESANARRDYLAFAALGTDHVDPLLRLAALIRAQDGRAGAREVFAELARGRSLAAAMVHALQFDGAERTSRLTAFADRHPDFAPVHAVLAAELGDDRQNLQTIDEKRRERAAVERFLAAERDGRLVPYFLDQSLLAQWIDRAQRRDAALRAFFAEGRDRITAQFTPTNTGWIASITPPEATTQIEYRLEATGAFRSTGVLQAVDERTGKPMPNPSFELARRQERTDIALRYVDAKGTRSAVTTVAFDPVAALRRGLRENLERLPNAWLAFAGGGNGLLIFTHLASHSCAIEKAEIGFNGAAPTEPLALPPCDPANPYRVPSDARPFLQLRPGTDSVAVRLTFVGGETSELRTFPRPR